VPLKGRRRPPRKMGDDPIIFQWLTRIGLQYAVPSFHAAGITQPDDLMKVGSTRRGVVESSAVRRSLLRYKRQSAHGTDVFACR
jgi:hypothetical protein